MNTARRRHHSESLLSIHRLQTDGSAISPLLEQLECRLLLSTVHVSAVTDPLEDGTEDHPYDSIQEAIDAASVGDTVLVGPGTYVEDLVITTDSLELASSGGPDVTVIKGVDVLAQASFPLADPNMDIQADGVSIHGFTIESPDVAEGFYSSGIVLTGEDIEIYGNSFVSIQAGAPQAGNDSYTNVAIQTYSGAVVAGSDIDGLSIHDNTFSGTPGKGYYGIYINPTDSADETILIERNTFSGTIWRAIVTERGNLSINANEITTDTDRSFGWGNTGIRAVTWDDSEIADVSISNNVVSGQSGGDGFSAGVSLGYGSQDFSDVAIQGNFIGDHTNGILVNAGAEGIAISNNDLSGNVTAAVNNQDTADLDASGNYWGAADPAGVAGQVIGQVDYTPWLVSGEDTEPADFGFQGDFTDLMVDDDSVQTGSSGRIQESIPLASGGTVTVAEGSYTEDLALDQGVSLIASGNVDLTGKHTITDGDVSLDGFDFVPGAEGMVIVVDTNGGSILNVSVTNSTFDFTATDGIAIWLGGPDPSGYVDEVMIEGNAFNGPASKIFNPMKIGGDFGNNDLDVQARDITFIDNTVDRGSMPVHLKDEDITNLVIESNVFTNTDGAVYVWCTNEDPLGELSGFQFIHNDVDATNSYGVGIDLDGENRFSDANFGDGNVINYNNFGIVPGAYGFGAVSILAGLTEYELDATKNYWGDATGPTHADNPSGAGAPISDNVDFTPWWATATTALDTENVRTGTSSGVRAYSDTIQGAIDAAAAGDTVVISSGTYVEDLVITTDDLLIMSSYTSQDPTVIKGVATLAWGSWPLASPNVDIQADGVKLSMLTFESPLVPNGEYSSGIVLSGIGITIESCRFLMLGEGDGGGVAVQTYRDDVLGVESDISDLRVMGNTFSGTPGGGYVGVWINHTNVGAGSVTIHNNVLTGNVYQGIATERSDTAITYNAINSVMVGAGQGIYIRDFDNRDQDSVSVNHNAVSGFGQGIRIGDAGGLQNLTNIDITDNYLTGNDVGVQVRASGGGVTISENDISGNATFGVENTDAAAVDATWNWWGSETGPTHATNPAGTGDAVSDNVLFDPFRSDPISAMPDLTVSFASLSLLDTQLPGEKTKAVLELTNIGNASSRGRVRLEVYASADGTLDMDDVLLGTVEIKSSQLKLGVGRSYKVNLYMPADLQPGTYSLIALADSWNNIDESNEGNNQAVSGQTFDVVWQFGTVAGTSNRSLRVANEDGEVVVFSLRSAGTGTVTLDGDGNLNVTTDASTTAATRITLTSANGGSINNFTAAAEIGQFLSGGVGVLGDLDFAGGVRKVAVAGLSGDGLVTIGQTANARGKVSLSLGTVADGSVTSAIPIQQLVVQQWTDDSDVRDVVAAPYIMTLKSVGDFQADLELAGVAGVRNALSRATLGALSDVVWNIGGNLNWLDVTGNIDGLEMNVTGTVGAVLTGYILSAEMTVTETLRRIWGTGWLDGYLIADRLGHMLFRGSNLGCDIILYNAAGAKQAADIIKTTSYIDDATIRINGDVRRVHAGAMQNSQILLGVSEAVSGLATGAEQLITDYRLGGFRIDSIYSFMSSFIDSCVVASRIAVGRLRNVSTDNSGEEFGLAAESIGDLELVQFGRQYGWPNHWIDPAEDFVVRIV